MKTSNPYGALMEAKTTPNIIGSDRSKNGSKAKPRFPHTPQSNQPGGGGSTSGSFRRAYTPGTTPSGS